jgi:hypothetical protein
VSGPPDLAPLDVDSLRRTPNPLAPHYSRFRMCSRLRMAERLLLDEPGARLALGANTHELVTRFLSAVDLAESCAHRPGWTPPPPS